LNLIIKDDLTILLDSPKKDKATLPKQCKYKLLSSSIKLPNYKIDDFAKELQTKWNDLYALK